MGGMDKLVDCKRCGRVFIRVSKDICPRCLQEVEREFLLCHEYLRDHPGATVIEIHEATGVSVKQIEEFVKEGRFQFARGEHLDYGCERCGRRIRKGRYCDHCSKELFHELSQAIEPKPRKESDLPRPSGSRKGYVIWERRKQHEGE